MKKTLIFMMAILFGIYSINAQNNCSKYYPMEEGASFTYTVYNKKGKVDGTTSYTVTDIKNDNNQTQSTLNMTYSDAKGKHSFDSNYGMTCTDMGIKIDYMSLMPSQMMNQYKDMDVEMDMEGIDIELPNDLSVGQQLADANVNVSMNMSGIKMKISVSTVDRNVLAKEQVTTPAGTFDCYVLSETIQSKSMGANLELISKTWLAEGVGMIKNETYKKNGTMQSRSELTKFSN